MQASTTTNVFIIGSKGIPARYGGFETFVENLVTRSCDGNIKYYVSCLGTSRDKMFQGATLFHIKVPNIGPAKAILYDTQSLIHSLIFAKRHSLNNVIIYILACRIGPFLALVKTLIARLGVRIYVNPDGQEWKRSKWNWATRKYWKMSERLMIKHADLIICDSLEIESYIRSEYRRYSPQTTYLSYGAQVALEDTSDNSLEEWYERFCLSANRYYLVVGRFVPENNYELIIREFMKTDVKRSLIIISNVTMGKHYRKLLSNTNFTKDPRVKLVGTVYDPGLLTKIRANAYAYIHGHEVGGTNPSLLESMSSTGLNLLLDVAFNREVGGEAAIYFSKDRGSLSTLIKQVESISDEDAAVMSERAKLRIATHYNWTDIVNKYEMLFSAPCISKQNLKMTHAGEPYSL